MTESKNSRQLRELYEQYGSLVHSRCLYLLKSKDDAWDATQEVFMKLNNTLDTLDKIESMHSWLLRVCTNHCLSMLRRKKGVSFDEEYHVAEHPAQSIEQRTILRDIVNQVLLPWDSKVREILIYTYVDGYTQPEIAALTGMGESTIRKYLTRFRRTAKQQLSTITDGAQ
jgi:RNA polymerase sigma-70 factor (ECF subfamily)